MKLTNTKVGSLYGQLPNIKPLVIHVRNKITINPKEEYVGQLKDKYSFIIIILLLTLGFGNILQFPLLMYTHGGVLFLIIYLFTSIIIVIPIYLIEIGLAQFYSKTGVTIYQITPFFRGLGWSSVMMNCFILVIRSSFISWSVLYIIYSIFTNMPWMRCGAPYPRIQCVDTTFTYKTANDTITYLSPSKIFFDVSIRYLRNPLNGSLYNYHGALGQIHLKNAFALMTVWLMIFLFGLAVLHLIHRFLIGVFLLIWLILLILLIRVACLPGSLLGIQEYINPKIFNTLTLVCFRDVVIYCFFSFCVGTTSIASFASLNTFHYNFFNASIAIIMGNYIFGFFCGVLQFSLLGFMSFMEKRTIADIIHINGDKFPYFVGGLSYLSGSRYFNIFFLFLQLTCGVCSSGMSIAALIFSWIDAFPNIFKLSQIRKLLFTLTLCSFYCFLSLLFSLTGSAFYQEVILYQMNNINIPIKVLLSISLVHFFYGTNRFKIELKMIFRTPVNCFWIVVSKFFIPILLVFCIIYSTIFQEVKDFKLATKLISNFATVICYIPLILGAILEMYKSCKRHRKSAIFSNLFRTPDIFGPYLKRNWLYERMYQRKLVHNRRNPEFIETVCETENLREIITELHVILTQKPPEKEEVQETPGTTTTAGEEVPEAV